MAVTLTPKGAAVAAVEGWRRAVASHFVEADARPQALERVVSPLVELALNEALEIVTADYDAAEAMAGVLRCYARAIEAVAHGDVHALRDQLIHAHALLEARNERG